MKKLSILMFSFAMFSICVGADWAEKQLDDARKADAITSANIAKERSEIIAKIDSLSKDISAIEKEIEKLKSHKTDLLSLSEKSKFNDSILDSVLSVASRNFGRDFQNVVSLADSKNAIDAQLKKIETELFSPIEPQLASVKRAKTGELLETLPKVKVFESEYVKKPVIDEKDKSFTVKKENGVYVVEGEWLYKIMQTVHFDDYESLNFFQRVLQSNGIIEKLEEMGIQEGDPVRIDDFEFDYVR